MFRHAVSIKLEVKLNTFVFPSTLITMKESYLTNVV